MCSCQASGKHVLQGQSCVDIAMNTKHGKVNTILHAYDATELFVCKLNKCMLPLQAIVRSLQPRMQHALAAILCIVEVLQQMHSFDESHNMWTDIAGCISLGSTNIVSRVPYFIDGCRVSKLGDKWVGRSLVCKQVLMQPNTYTLGSWSTYIQYAHITLFTTKQGRPF